MKQLFTLLVLGLFLVNPFQVLGKKKNVQLPTSAYRTYETGENFKVEYTYDEHGHVSLEKRYFKNGDNYLLIDSIAKEYHKLLNGKFIVIKEERKGLQAEYEWGREEDRERKLVYKNPFHYRFTSDYDSKGMKLYEQNESYNFSEAKWIRTYREEAVLNSDGIRIAVWEYEGQSVSILPFTFDNKGRVLTYIDEGEKITYTWGNDGMIASMNFSGDNQNYSFDNITTAFNEVYFDPYNLFPIMERNDDAMDGGVFHFRDIQEYAWNDYTMKRWIFDADFFIGEHKGNIKASIDNEKREIVRIASLAEVEMEKEIYKILDNGGWEISYISAGETTDVSRKEYNEFGALIKDYNFYGEYSSEYSYLREYDEKGRPVKTTYTNFVETYDAWTNTLVETSLEKPTLLSVSVYPNPANNYVVIDGASGAELQVYDLSGRPVYKQEVLETENETINISGWDKGIYLFSIKNELSSSVIKIVIQ